MKIKHEATPNFAASPCKVFKLGVISEALNEAIKKALYKKKKYIEDMEDAVCVIVIDKKNRHSLLTSEPMTAMDFIEDSEAGESSTCYDKDKDGVWWIVTCQRNEQGDMVGAYKECCLTIPPCPDPRRVDLKGEPCLCEKQEAG